MHLLHALPTWFLWSRKNWPWVFQWHSVCSSCPYSTISMIQIKLTMFRLPVEVSQYITIQKGMQCEQVAQSLLLKWSWYWRWSLCASVPKDIIFLRYPKTTTSGNYAWSKEVHWNPQYSWGCKFVIENLFSITEWGCKWRESQTAAAEEIFWQV